MNCIITTEAVRIVAKCSRLRLGRGVCAGWDWGSVGRLLGSVSSSFVRSS